MIADILVATVLMTASQETPSEVQRLAGLLTGSWTSADQAAGDPAYDEILTRFAPLPDLSPGSADDVWLYNESAYAERPAAPYRQTVTRLSAGPDGRPIAEAFRLAEPAAFAGWTPDRAPPAVEALIALEGCTTTYTASGDGFDGAMAPGACKNRYRGADHLDSRSRVTPDALETWDRGFRDDGTQVWGPVAGGYRFRRP